MYRYWIKHPTLTFVPFVILLNEFNYAWNIKNDLKIIARITQIRACILNFVVQSLDPMLTGTQKTRFDCSILDASRRLCYSDDGMSVSQKNPLSDNIQYDTSEK